MNIVRQKIKGQVYIYLRESYWDPVRKKYTSRNVKSYGRLDKLLEQNPNFLEDLEREVAQYTEDEEARHNETLRKKATELKIATDQVLDSNQDNPATCLGPYVLKRVWDKLAMPRKLKEIQGDTNINFDLASCTWFLTAARILMPDSKLAQWQRANQLMFNGDKFKLHHLYRSLDTLIANKDKLVTYLNKQITKNYGRVPSVVLYDVTTYFFESQDAGDLRNFGFSKDNKVNQVQVVMGLLIDQNGIPIDYELFPGNQNEFGTMLPILEKLRSKYGIQKVIVTADRGLNSGANLLAIKRMGFEYVIAHRIRSSSAEVKKLIDNAQFWHSYKGGSGTLQDISRYCITDDIRKVPVTENGKRHTEVIKSKLLLNYSSVRAKKDAHDRSRLVEKAKRLAENPALLKSELKRGGKSYLSIRDDQLEVTVNEQKITDAARYDGFYGITYSDASMTPQEVLKIHHSLWQIEESFRISKSLLQARPCFHWTDARIKAHFLVCYMALVIFRLLELELTRQGLHLTADRITDALRNAQVLAVQLGENDRTFCKANTEGDFEAISQGMGLKPIPRIATPQELKAALRVRDL